MLYSEQEQGFLIQKEARHPKWKVRVGLLQYPQDHWRYSKKEEFPQTSKVGFKQVTQIGTEVDGLDVELGTE